MAPSWSQGGLRSCTVAKRLWRRWPWRPALMIAAAAIAATALSDLNALAATVAAPPQPPQPSIAEIIGQTPEKLPVSSESGKPIGPFQQKIPRLRPMYRAIETAPPKRRRFSSIAKEKPYYKLMWTLKKKVPKPTIPGDVQRPTRREESLRVLLRKGEKPPAEDFDITIQVFAQRARQEMQWVAVQRREFLRRAKRWAGEMLLQEMEPSPLSLRLILLACEATGDVSGARWWFSWMERYGVPIRRMEYNAMIGAHGEEGQPHEARHWLERMRRAGFPPDAKSYAGVMEGWERIGNRQQMLKTLLEMQEVEEGGELGEPRRPIHSALPYYAMARTYAKVGDAARAISVLKVLQAKNLEIDSEVHRLRLEAHLRAPLSRRSIDEVECAFVDLIESREGDEKLCFSRLSSKVARLLGQERYEFILHELGVSPHDIIAEVVDAKAMLKWRKECIADAYKRHRPGLASIRGSNLDENFFRKRIEARKGPKMGEIAGGYFRVPNPDRGLPEWMTLPKPVKYG